MKIFARFSRALPLALICLSPLLPAQSVATGTVIFTSLADASAEIAGIEQELDQKSGTAAAREAYEKRMADIGLLKQEAWENAEEFSARVQSEGAKELKVLNAALLAAKQKLTTDPVLVALVKKLAAADAALAAKTFFLEGDALALEVGDFDTSPEKSWPLDLSISAPGLSWTGEFSYSIKGATDMGAAYKAFQALIDSGTLHPRLLIKLGRDGDPSLLLVNIKVLEIRDGGQESLALVVSLPQDRKVLAFSAREPGIALSPRFSDTELKKGFVSILAGSFLMGSPTSEAERGDDEVQHQVSVSAFALGKYEVTQDEWKAIMGSNPSHFQGDSLPVESVSWREVVVYCNKRSIAEGLGPCYSLYGKTDPAQWEDDFDTQDLVCNWNASGYRLPTEAEWEYACRAGTQTPFSTGQNISTAQANYDGDYPYNGAAKGISREKTTAVGELYPQYLGPV